MCLSPQATFRLGWGLRRSLKQHGMGWKTLEGTESRPPNLQLHEVYDQAVACTHDKLNGVLKTQLVRTPVLFGEVSFVNNV